MLAQISLLCAGGYDFENQTVLLTSDIDLGGIDWIPIGSFSNSFCGTFDGGNFTISNLTVSSNPNNPEGKKDRSVGLIGYAIGATVKNLKIANCNISGKYAVGAVVGEADGSSLFENIEILSGTVKADQDVYSIDKETQTEVLSYSAQVAGGILGIGYGETVNASGNIIYAGTIVFRNCINRANVTVNKQHAGGLWGSITFAGQCDVTVENCSNYGTITSNSISHNLSAGGYAGGLGGFFDAKSLTITNSQNHGIVSAENHRGDLVGFSSLINGSVNAAETI